MSNEQTTFAAVAAGLAVLGAVAPTAAMCIIGLGLFAVPLGTIFLGPNQSGFHASQAATVNQILWLVACIPAFLTIAVIANL